MLPHLALSAIAFALALLLSWARGVFADTSTGPIGTEK